MKTQLSDYEKKHVAEKKVGDSLLAQKNVDKGQQLKKKLDDARNDSEKAQHSLVTKMKTYTLERNLEIKVSFFGFFEEILCYLGTFTTFYTFTNAISC